MSFYASYPVTGGGGGGAVTSVNGQTGVVVLNKADIGLSNVDNTSDANKPVSTATQNALNLKANLSGATFTGAISATNLSGTNTGDQNLSAYALLASPTFTGTPLAPTAALNNNSTQIATTAYVDNSIAAIPDPIVYKGTWNAATNTPTLSNSDTNVEGFLYQVSVAGSVDFGAGSISFAIGDKVVNNGSLWQKWDLTDAVLSVNGQTGIVVLTKSDISLGNVDNTSDANKPVSTAAQTALNLKADLAGAIFSGSISATNLSGTNTGDQNLSAYALLASPALTGIPTAPTASGGTNTTQIATTAFVTAAVASGGGATYSVVTKTANYTITTADTHVIGDATSAAFTLTFPPAASATNKLITVKKSDSSFNAITLSGTGMTTNYLMTVGEEAQFISDGTSWIQVQRKTDTPWIQFTATYSAALTTTSDEGAFWRRVGNCIDLKQTVSYSTTTGTTFDSAIPNAAAWTVDTSQMSTTTNSNSHGVAYQLSGSGNYPVTGMGPYPIFSNTAVSSTLLYIAFANSGSRFRSAVGTELGIARLRLEASGIPITNFSA